MSKTEKLEKTKASDILHIRAGVEGLYIALVLALVLRAFLVEAFVIPTGSMATSLYGEHYELTCPACQYEYAFGRPPVNASMGRPKPFSEAVVPDNHALCPNCGFRYGGDGIAAKPVRGVGGDRVIVMKFIYDFISPKPWDVVVFKNPQNNRENYIKRLIGLPGETIEIILGDIFYKTDGHDWQIRRKPESAQSVMWYVVYNSDFVPQKKYVDQFNMKVPHWKSDTPDSSWNLTGDGGREFAFTGSDKPSYLRFNPGIKLNGLSPWAPFSGYNPPELLAGQHDVSMDVCTDWQLSAVVDVGETPADFSIYFENRASRFRADFSTTGRVELWYQSRDKGSADEWQKWGSAKVDPFRPGIGRKIALRDVDMQASVWVDGEKIITSSDEQYGASFATAYKWANIREYIDDAVAKITRLESRGDSPELRRAKDELEQLKQRWQWYSHPSVYMAASGGEFTMRHVNLYRDVYYTSPTLRNPVGNGEAYSYTRGLLMDEMNPVGPNSWKRNVDGLFKGWGATGNPIKLRKDESNSDLDEFFCMGDNSMFSHDGRTWTSAAPTLRLFNEKGDFQYQLGTVPRYNLIGRALFVFWPGSYRIPILELPIVPRAGKMRFIR